MGNEPTIIPTVSYRKRFLENMDKYFIAVYHDEEVESFEEIMRLAEKKKENSE